MIYKSRESSNQVPKQRHPVPFGAPQMLLKREVQKSLRALPGRAGMGAPHGAQRELPHTPVGLENMDFSVSEK